MVRIRRVNATVIDQPRQASTRAQSPAQIARQKRENQFRQLVESLSSPDDVSLVTPNAGEKLATVRIGLRKVAQEMGKERDVIVRKYEDGFLVSLSTPEREAARRGRKPKG